MIIQDYISRVLSAVAGDARHYTLEHRLFNTISLLNAVANAGGALNQVGAHKFSLLLPLHLITALGFAACYFAARFRHRFRSLYWPFILLMLAPPWPA